MADWIRHALIGGIGAVTLGRLAEKYASDENGLDDKEKKTLLGTSLGAISGGTAAYLVSDKLTDNNTCEKGKKKMLGTLLGTAAGGIAGYHLAQDINHDDYKASNEKESDE